jgi:hypothetical protein
MIRNGTPLRAWVLARYRPAAERLDRSRHVGVGAGALAARSFDAAQALVKTEPVQRIAALVLKDMYELQALSCAVDAAVGVQTFVMITFFFFFFF